MDRKHLPIDNGLDLFVDAMTTRDPDGAVERQEQRGQRALQNADVLPIIGTIEPEHGDTTVYREHIEALGFQFGEPVDGLFVECTLPQGWKKRPTEHTMWSELLDDKGRVRALIFYKAAFYDRGAHINWERRYYTAEHYAPTPDEPNDYDAPDRENQLVCYVAIDRAQPSAHPGDKGWREGAYIWHGPSVRNYDWHASDQRRAEAREWLRTQYPQSDDPFAYWDE